MARRPRIEVAGGIYHVYNRVGSGESVFSNSDEATTFLEIVREVKKRDGWTLFAWCLMSNHFHLVLRTATIPLWRSMHAVLNRYSRGFNRRSGRTGGLWQSRYQARYVSHQEYLDQLILYVHLNPVTAGLVEDPAAYPFSGHREVKNRLRDPLIDIDDMLLSFGEAKKQARRNYLRAIRRGIDLEDGVKASVWHPFIASADVPLEGQDDTTKIDMLGRSADLERPTLDAGEFIRRLCKIAGFDLEHLRSRARDREAASNRRLIVTLGAERWRQKRIDLASVLDKNPDVVSWWIGEGTKRRMEDSAFAETIDKLDRALSASLTGGST